MTDATKVLTWVQDCTVFYQRLADTPFGPTLDEREFIRELGPVRHIVVDGVREGTRRKVWQWSCGDKHGQGPTKAAAIDRMLACRGYEAVADTVVIPDLLAGLLDDDHAATRHQPTCPPVRTLVGVA